MVPSSSRGPGVGLRERFTDESENRDVVTSSLLADPPSSFGSLLLQSLCRRRCLIAAAVSCVAPGCTVVAGIRSGIAGLWFSRYASAFNCSNFQYGIGVRYNPPVWVLAICSRPFPMRRYSITFQYPNECTRTCRRISRLDEGRCPETSLS